MSFKRTRSRRIINRREFMRGAALLGGAAATHVTLPSSWAPTQMPSLSILDLPASLSPIDHIVVLMMENRSFDHYLGWLATDEHYLELGRRRYGSDFSVDGDQNQLYRDAAGNNVATYHLASTSGEANPYRGCGHPDPGHGWNAGRAERDGGFLAPDSGNDKFALGYYQADDVPFYASLARRFTTFDRYHCSLLGPTFPNREYLHSAQSGGNKENSSPPIPFGYSWQTIWDKLAKAKVPISYYYSDLPVIGLWGPRLVRYAHRLDNYFDDARSGKLPNVVFIDPAFSENMRTDDHPFADIRAGQRFAHDVFRAFVESPHWKSGCFILTYDEWGGFFDHVAPPMFPDDRASENDRDNFGQGGFRVSTILASPYARPGFLDHRLYEHTSILRFIEWRFLGAPPEGPGMNGDSWYLTTRDRHANNIGASLTLDGFDPEVELESPVTTVSPQCSGNTNSLTMEKHAFEQLRDSGYFEAVGYKIE